MGKRQHLERKGGKLKAFIPSWLNRAGLSKAEFRVYCCLASRADKDTRIAWPEAKTIARDCCMAMNSVWPTLKALEEKQLLRRIPKPFAGSNRYQVLEPISAKDAPIEAASIEPKDIPIEAAQSDQKAYHQSDQNRYRQSDQKRYREGKPKNANQGMLTNKGKIELPFSSDEFREAWTEWEQHRREIKKPLTPTSTERQLKTLASIGEAEAIAAIHRSISNGWTGIFPASSKAKPDHREAKARREYPEPSNPLPML
jgi:DNA-binding MarR family transcriptional regulator